MAEPSPNATPQDGNTGPARESKAGITPDQVRAIADRVYVMLLKELSYERERERISASSARFSKGGA